MKQLFDLDKEASLLGCYLLRNDLIDELNAIESYFTHDEYRKVYKALKLARSKKITVDAMMLTKLGLTGDAMASITAVSTAANASWYADELRKLWKLRELRILCDDCGSMVYSEEPEKVIELMERTITGFISNHEQGYKKVSDSVPALIENIEKSIKNKGSISGVPTGLASFDNICSGLQKQDYIIIGARPSQGKTALALLMINSAAKAGFKVGVISAEMGTISLLKRTMSQEGRIEADKIRTGFLSDSDMVKMDEVFTYLATTNIFINDSPNIKLKKLISESRLMRRNENIDILFVDYIGLIGNDTNKPRHEQVAEISMNLKSLARELDIPLVALSQLTRDAQGQRPQLNQLRESSQLEADADIIGMLHNDGDLDGNPDIVKYQLLIAKARNYPTRDIDLLFYKKYTRFQEKEWSK